ncbi:MAG: gliding motility-associated C-terminal domain-containing protein [Bacteroidota bacterium]|nr:gliding motility-associated C-terminal domain-containing protein [Bacteroidota bacterium]
MKRLFIFCIIFITYFSAFATHNRAGQIVYRHISGYTYEITVWTYTYSESLADRDSLEVDFGDGTTKWLSRNIKLYLPDYYIENRYQGIYTFNGPGTFNIVVQDPNRNKGVINIPNSVNVVFALSTILQINPFLGHNNAAVMTTRPIDKAAKNRIFIHNPGAYDPDGDSLSFKMDVCRQEGGVEIPGFTLPPATNSITVDPITGDLIWDSPPNIGVYNVAMRIEEWRQGVLIGVIIRDIQIEVEETDNNPPVIDPLVDYCVVAGDTVEFDVHAVEPDNQIVYLMSSGGPFQLTPSPAVFPDSIFGTSSVTGTFTWYTACEHVSNAPYIVTFKAKDNDPEVSLVDYETMSIKVIGPAVQFTDIQTSNTNIILNWDKSTCSNVTGYKIYRRNDTENFSIEYCQTGIPDSWGYKLIKTIDDPNQEVYIDNLLDPGFLYCYRIVAVFDEKLDGQPSDKACIELSEGLPIFTKVSVLHTAVDTGIISVKWRKVFGIDTVQYPRPHRYILTPSRDLYGTNFLTSTIFPTENDTVYVDSNVNTKDNPSCYKLEIQSYDTISHNWINMGDPAKASTPYLTIYSSDKKNQLNINTNVPWINDTLVVYKYNETTFVFDSIGFSLSNSYTDLGLINEQEYCYKVKTIGHYTASQLKDTIINFSQIRCGTPIDTIPPCCPEFVVESECDLFRNKITWTMPADSCYEGLAELKVYYSSNIDDEPEFLESFSPSDSIFYHSPDITLAACYYLNAVDSAGNESACSENLQCVDNCEYYELPNIFTPNSDNINDLFHPLPYKFVDHIDLKIYNRWGNLVFSTEDPDINWDGTNLKTGSVVPDGVYYYICDVYEFRLTGLVPRNISGFIHVVANKGSQKP